MKISYTILTNFLFKWYSQGVQCLLDIAYIQSIHCLIFSGCSVSSIQLIQRESLSFKESSKKVVFDQFKLISSGCKCNSLRVLLLYVY